MTHLVANPHGYGPANPESVGSNHTKGIAIDLTLVSSIDFREVDFGGQFDDPTEDNLVKAIPIISS